MKPYGMRRSDATCCTGHNKSSKKRNGHRKAKKRARRLGKAQL